MICKLSRSMAFLLSVNTVLITEFPAQSATVTVNVQQLHTVKSMYLHYRRCRKYSPSTLSKQIRVGTCHLHIQLTSSCMFSQSSSVCSTDFIFKYSYKNKSHWVMSREHGGHKVKFTRFIWNSQQMHNCRNPFARV